jgi:hypothetical protein
MEFVGVCQLGNNQIDQKDQVENQKTVEVDVSNPFAHTGVVHYVITVVFD